MPSANSIVQAITSGGKFCPSAAGGASSTSEFQFQGSDSHALICWIPGGNKVKNRPLRIRMWGTIASASTPNFTMKMYYGTSDTIANNTNIATSGTVACTNAGNFLFECMVIWDDVSNAFNGNMRGWVCGTLKTDTTLTAVTKPGLAPSVESDTSLTAQANSNGLGITFTGTFSGSNAANSAILSGAEIEVL